MLGRAVCGLIRVYQRVHVLVLPRMCIHSPTCSHYMIGAIRAHGVFWGVGMGVRRILRCHPWARGGYDPVPPRAARPLTDGNAAEAAQHGPDRGG